MKFGIIGLPRSTEPPDERQLREARIAAARRNPRWQEIPDDLVPRGPFLVSAATDELFTPHRGTNWKSGKAVLIADQAALVFTVSDDGVLRFFDRQPGTLVGNYRAQGSAHRGEMTYTALIRVAPIETLERHNDPAWARPGRTLYNRLRFLPCHDTVPLLVDHRDEREIGYVHELVRLEAKRETLGAKLARAGFGA